MTNSTSAPLEIRRVIAAPIEEVFAAWLDQDGMREWFTPSGAATMTADFRPGGSFHLVMSDENVSVEPMSLSALSTRQGCSSLPGARNIRAGTTRS